jgi:muramoyltetrapeptide carboxypeptidase LdcA involved in peptidoglycan recycling
VIVPELTPIYPAKLHRGDTVRVVAPSQSRALVLEHDHSKLIEARFGELGLGVTFGEHVDERDDFDSAPIGSRVADIHAAFADRSVHGILTAIGGFNSNELLPHLDWHLIAQNPKVFCGYSDITALQNAILAHTGLVTYSGPHWSTFGMRDHLETTLDWFRKACLEEDPFDLHPSPIWTDDPWFRDQDGRILRTSERWWSIRGGRASGRLVGGNLCTLNLLQGTPHMPSLDGAVLAVEDDELSDPAIFARDLTSLLQQPGAAGIRGLLIGRFQQASGMSRDLLEQILHRQERLIGLPVMANVDFGHTSPLATLPIGGQIEFLTGDNAHIRILQH